MQDLAKVERARMISSANNHRPGSSEVKEKLKKLGADEVFTESQLEIKNIKGLLVILLLPPPNCSWYC
jgi:mitochondrial enoyl-[acyl-carrier protein] reductase / trans-2-enoyl-CoA reductase